MKPSKLGRGRYNRREDPPKVDMHVRIEYENYRYLEDLQGREEFTLNFLINKILRAARNNTGT